MMQIIWEPYMQLIERLPEYCLNGRHIWTTRSPLICFFAVEWHLPDRVMRQFGWMQHIPAQCKTDMQLHTYDLRGRHERSWVSHLAPQITEWENRHNVIIQGQHINMDEDVEPRYYCWYYSITRRYITRAGASYNYLVRIYLLFS